MTSIEDLQARLSTALQRIDAAVVAYEPPAAAPVDIPAPEPEPAPEPQADAAEVQALREALEDERLANAQLEERIRVLKERAPEPAPEPVVDTSEADALREQLAAQRAGLEQIDTEMQRLKQANDALRDVCEALRAANARGVGDASLINKAILTELESLRAARALDAAETGAVLATLTPLLDAAIETNAGEAAQ